MNYTALYRQFRPQDFEELVGQDHISTTLLNSIKGNKIAHAYLFSGSRGTGKTSTAKIFAKAVNCLEPHNGEPCNKCQNCIKITEGNSLDVLEIDAASNRGIDEIRDLREKVKYAPAEGKYKVYIIDEVHMLTTEAFNALLKTLEEPPHHVIFILATTEPHKLPPTIISRCQRFDFKRIAFTSLLAQLKKVAGDVGIDVDDKALFIIAGKAEGGMRDALSLLDQSAAYGNGTVTYNTVIEILGAVEEKEIINLLRSILSRDAVGMLEAIERHVMEGKDLKSILHELQECVRNTILIKLSNAKPETMEEETYQNLVVLSELGDANKFYHLLEVLAETENTMKFAAQARITLEVGLLRTLSENVQKVPLQQKQATEVKANITREVQKVVAEKPREQYVSEKVEIPTDMTEIWKKLLADVKKTQIRLHAFLVEGIPVAFSNNIFKIEFENEKEFHFHNSSLPENIKAITLSLQKILGKQQIKPELVLRTKGKKQENMTEKVQQVFSGYNVEIID